MVAHVGLVQPPTVVAHEVPHPTLAFGGVQERQCPVQGRRPHLRVATACELERDDGQPRDIVDAIAAVTVGNDPVRVLHNPDVVDKRE